MTDQETIPVVGLVIHQRPGRIGPKFVCQECGESIEDPFGGLMLWNPNGEKVVIMHKSCRPPGTYDICYSGEIGTMLMYLLWNSGIRDDNTLKHWQEIARSLGQF